MDRDWYRFSPRTLLVFKRVLDAWLGRDLSSLVGPWFYSKRNVDGCLYDWDFRRGNHPVVMELIRWIYTGVRVDSRTHRSYFTTATCTNYRRLRVARWLHSIRPIESDALAFGFHCACCGDYPMGWLRWVFRQIPPADQTQKIFVDPLYHAIRDRNLRLLRWLISVGADLRTMPRISIEIKIPFDPETLALVEILARASFRNL